MEDINEGLIKRVKRAVQRMFTGKTPRAALSRAEHRAGIAGAATVKNAIVNNNNPESYKRISDIINLPKHVERVEKIQKITKLQEVISRIHEAKKEKKIIYFDWPGYPNSEVVEKTPRKPKPIIPAPIKDKGKGK